jgi:putative aldouronate transport system substrate-binding protein
MRSKSLVTLLLVFVMVLSMLSTSCSKPSSEEGNKAEVESESNNDKADSTTKSTDDATKPDPITFTVFIGEPRQAPTKDNKIYKMLEEELGVTFEFDF